MRALWLVANAPRQPAHSLGPSSPVAAVDSRGRSRACCAAGARRWRRRMGLGRDGDAELDRERDGSHSSHALVRRRHRAARLRESPVARRPTRDGLAALSVPPLWAAVGAPALPCGARHRPSAQPSQNLLASPALARPGLLPAAYFPTDGLAAHPRTLSGVRLVVRHRGAPGVATRAHRLPHGGRRDALPVGDGVDAPVGPHGDRLLLGRVPRHQLGRGGWLVSRYPRGRRQRHQRHDVAECRPVRNRPVELCAVSGGGFAGPDG
mmetsp:Transcript_31041/g.99177  ORF Transcript_31041/g.99177 Transcript_31041/m.99177 type:complete len:265 (-) Transcript_31041:955-1749(-)